MNRVGRLLFDPYSASAAKAAIYWVTVTARLEAAPFQNRDGSEFFTERKGIFQQFVGVLRCAAERTMIQLTRLNTHPLVVNSDLIKFVEQSPDTVITLVNGEKIVVRESAQEVLARVVEFRRSVLQGIMLWWDNRAALSPTPDAMTRTAEEK